MRAYTRCETPALRDCLRPGVSDLSDRSRSPWIVLL